jgi:FdhE protein
MDYCIKAVVENREKDIYKIAAHLGLQPLVLKFILWQMLKPFVEKRTKSLHVLMADLPWNQGHCPVCGTLPELSFILVSDGQRWLRCALCGHEWRFEWTICPGCGHTNESREFIYIEGLKHEWIEDCPVCRRYIVGIDLRNQSEITTDIATIGMVHLDILAQRKGFFPLAEYAWNMVAPMN